MRDVHEARLLIVDDEPELRRMLVSILRGDGYADVHEAATAAEAMARAVNESFPTVMTSGTIMTVAGILIAYRVSDVYIGHIGLAVGRGALISVILVLSVLPQLIVLLDKVIEKTTFRKKTTTGGAVE